MPNDPRGLTPAQLLTKTRSLEVGQKRLNKETAKRDREERAAAETAQKKAAKAAAKRGKEERAARERRAAADEKARQVYT